jgi:hypothetical protein
MDHRSAETNVRRSSSPAKRRLPYLTLWPLNTVSVTLGHRFKHKGGHMENPAHVNKIRSLSDVGNFDTVGLVEGLKLYLSCPQTRVFFKLLGQSNAFEAWVR